MDKVNEIANVAGVLNRKGMVQKLTYSNNWMKEDYKLLELTNELVNVLQEGDVITIQGDTDDDCVMCTTSKTYELKAAETSNSLLLLPNLFTPKSTEFTQDVTLRKIPVCSCFSSYYEVRQSRPRLERLKNILDENAFSNKDHENDEIQKFTTDGLLSLIQASKNELMQALKTFGAFQIDGYWRILEINYQEKAFSQILALVEEESWDWKEIPLKSTCDTLHELYPSFVLEHCLQTYGDRIVERMEEIYCLNEEKVCRYYAEYILRPALGKFNYHEFMEAWEQSIPDGMTVNLNYLQGVALTDLKHHPPVTWHFPERNLPDNAEKRFNLLFQMRSKWTDTDIEPYVRNLVGPGQKLSSLFLKYTRTSKNEKGEKIYSSKHPTT